PNLAAPNPSNSPTPSSASAPASPNSSPSPASTGAASSAASNPFPTTPASFASPKKSTNSASSSNATNLATPNSINSASASSRRNPSSSNPNSPNPNPATPSPPDPCDMPVPKKLARPLCRSRHAQRSLPRSRSPQPCATPPSINNSAPVINALSSDARYPTALAISSARPNRPSGTCDKIFDATFSCSSFCNPILPNNGVSIGPGLTTLTRIFRGASSTASDLARLFSAAFVKEYALDPAIPKCATVDEVMITEAPSFNSGSAFCTAKYTPLMFVFTVSLKNCSVTSPNGTNFATPALAKSTSICPTCSRTASNAFSRSDTRVTSAVKPIVPEPTSLAARATASPLRPIRITRAPCAFNSCAAASPMPLFPPVTTATLFASFMISVSV